MVTDDGTKVPLGVVEGCTENAAVCTRLVADLADRGVDATRGVLFVVDGGKAAAKAIRDVYGDLAQIQRYRPHKERNILDHLPHARASPDPAQAARCLGHPRPRCHPRRARVARPHSGQHAPRRGKRHCAKGSTRP